MALQRATGPNTTGSITCFLSTKCGDLKLGLHRILTTSNLDSTIMAYELFCIIPNGKPAFVVNIDETRTVASLKVAIKAVKAPELDHIAPDNLTLYRVNLDGSDEPEYIKEAERFAESLVNLDLHPLKQFDLLDMVFPEPPNSRDRNIHIFVILPPGKPINSRAYRLALIVYHSPITPLSYNIDLNAVRILCGLQRLSHGCPQPM